MMILAMVRHGQTYYNANGLVQGRINIPLNETGKRQARDLALSLIEKGELFDLVASSPLSRAMETAYIMTKKMKMKQPICVDNRFVERDFFHLDGKPVGEAMPLVRQKNYTFQGYENDQQLIKRIADATHKFYRKYPDKRVLFVAHSHVIKALRIYVDPEKYSFSDIIDNTDIIYFKIENNHLSILE